MRCDWRFGGYWSEIGVGCRGGGRWRGKVTKREERRYEVTVRREAKSAEEKSKGSPLSEKQCEQWVTE